MCGRLSAMTRPKARYKTELTLDDHFKAARIADPPCRYDFCLENDIAIAEMLTSAERAT